MPTPAPKFLAADKTNPEFPNVTAWAVEEFVNGNWSLYLADYTPVFRPTRERT
ncbi:hypothetical protein SAMN04488144_13229 [Methylobacterium sp. 190mf]|nr:hypothetical protein SAMN04488144_13229 [Methylobacterium sp. 190mf]